MNKSTQTRPDIMALTKPSVSEIRPHLFIGNIYSTLNTETLRTYDIGAIVSLMDARHGRWGAPSIRSIVPEGNHLYIPCLDSSTMDILSFMSDACDFIEKHVCGPSTDDDDDDDDDDVHHAKNVLVHCREGVSRSASIVIAYLMRKENLGLDQVLAQVQEKRKVRPSPNFIGQLRVWEAVGYQVWQDDERKIPKEEYREFLDKRLTLLKSKGLTGDEPIGIQSL